MILQKYMPPEILQNYTSATVAHGVTDLTPWPTALGAYCQAVTVGFFFCKFQFLKH
jgi:hypothetical protein